MKPSAAPLPSNASLLVQGQHLHAVGQRVQALALFEQALAEHPESLDAANACAALLVELGKSKQAFHLLDFRRTAVLQHADSACNWAIVCEEVHQIALAREAYEAALLTNANHLRSLNNSALLAAREQRWDTAIERTQRLHQLLPQDVGISIMLGDMLTCALRDEEALQQMKLLLANQPALEEAQIRHATLLAFTQRWDAAANALDQLSPAAREKLMSYLETISISASRFGWHAKRLPSPQMLYQLHAFKAMLDADWHGQADLIGHLRAWIAQSHANLEAHDWRDLQFYALMLPLTEELQGQSLQDGRRYFVQRAGEQQLPAWKEHDDGRIHLAIASQDSADERQRQLLCSWLSRVDRNRFAIHLFAQTPSASQARDAQLVKLADSYTNIAPINSLDAVQRIRAFQAHIFMDTAYYTPSCRAELPFFGVAPVQLRHISWQRLNPGTVQFVMGDLFTHPDGFKGSTNHHGAIYGPTLRMPHSCWLHVDETLPAAAQDRAALKLPQGALVLCSRVGAAMIDPESFSLWMKILQALPHAVLWLPSYETAAQINLRKSAERAGIGSQRIVFAQAAQRSSYLAQMRHADLFLDPLLFNANHGLAEALRMGVPAITCAGHNMASRLGGSILQAAGLGEQVFDSEVMGREAAKQRYVERAIALGSQPAQLAALKNHLQTQLGCAPYFNAGLHIAQWQAAWQTMADQARQGLTHGNFHSVDIKI